jgi:hypothetical protein
MKSEMALQRLVLCFAGFIIAIFISACTPTGSNGAPPQRISLTHAENLVRTMIFEQESDMNPTAQFSLKEITTDEIWQRLNVQVFKVVGDSVYPDESFLIKDERVQRLGIGFGGSGLMSMQVVDLDENNEPELIYTYSYGSGLHRSMIAAYCRSWPGDHIITSELAYLYGDLILNKIDEHTVMLEAGFFDLQERFTTEATLGGLLLTKDSGKSHLEVQLKNNLPRHITERIKLLSE